MMQKNKILITGAHGFLGKHLVKELQEAGYQNLLTPTHQELNLYDHSYRTSIFKIVSWLCQKTPDVIIHLAARVGGIGANRARPAEFFEDNLMMGMNLFLGAQDYNRLILRECGKTGIKKILVTGTVCSYPKHTKVPFQESDFWLGYPEETNAPYGIAKKALYVYSQCLRERDNLNTVFVMPTNLVGEYDHFTQNDSHVIPDLIRKLIDARNNDDKIVTLWGDGSPTREFMYAGDCAKAIRLALEKYDGNDFINLGTGVETKIKDVVRMIADKVGYKGSIHWDASKPNGQPRRSLDISKMKKYLDFTPEVSLDEALNRTIQWYENRDKA